MDFSLSLSVLEMFFSIRISLILIEQRDKIIIVQKPMFVERTSKWKWEEEQINTKINNNKL